MLRPVEREDYRTLFAWRSDLHEVHLWTTQGRRIITFEQFVPECEQWLHESIVLLAEDRTTGHLLGFGRAYNLDPADGWAWIQVYATPETRARPYHFAEAGSLFVDYLFAALPLRKLQSEVFSYNETALRLHERIGCREQGRFVDHVWWKDRYWDSILFALWRQDWLETRERLAFLLRVESELNGHQTHEDVPAHAGGNL